MQLFGNGFRFAATRNIKNIFFRQQYSAPPYLALSLFDINGLEMTTCQRGVKMNLSSHTADKLSGYWDCIFIIPFFIAARYAPKSWSRCQAWRSTAKTARQMEKGEEKTILSSRLRAAVAMRHTGAADTGVKPNANDAEFTFAGILRVRSHVFRA